MPKSCNRRSCGAGRAFAGIALGICIVLGVIGIVLPVIPGIVFLIIAAFIAFRHFPTIATRLRRVPGVARHWRYAERWPDLGLGAKVRLVGWLSLRAALDGLAAMQRWLARGSGASPFA